MYPNIPTTQICFYEAEITLEFNSSVFIGMEECLSLTPSDSTAHIDMSTMSRLAYLTVSVVCVCVRACARLCACMHVYDHHHYCIMLCEQC